MQTNARPGQGLGATARWIAGVRAKESTRADRLFNDPWAAALAGKEGLEWVERWSAADLAPIVLRTCFFDDVLSRIAFDGAIRQVVLMAAGLDTRAFRLDWPAQTRLFELDKPAVLKYKERILRSASARPACVRRTLGVDLTKLWQPALIEKGFDPCQPSAWLLEGFLYYLSNERLRHLLGEVSRLAVANSWIAFDIMNSTVLNSVWCRRWVEMQDRSEAPWIGTMDDPEQLLATLGWKAHVTQAGQPGIHHGRWPYPVISPRRPMCRTTVGDRLHGIANASWNLPP